MCKIFQEFKHLKMEKYNINKLCQDYDITAVYPNQMLNQVVLNRKIHQYLAYFDS